MTIGGVTLRCALIVLCIYASIQYEIMRIVMDFFFATGGENCKTISKSVITTENSIQMTNRNVKASSTNFLCHV